MLLISFIFSLQLWAQDLFINEEMLLQSAKSQAPSTLQIEGQLLQSKLKRSLLNEKFSPQILLSGMKSHSEESQLSSFDLVNKDVSNYSVGVNMPTSYGVQAAVHTDYSNSTNTYVENAKVAKLRFETSLDLYSDLFGRTSRKMLMLEEVAVEKAKRQYKIDLKVYLNNVRKLYWSLVANNEAMKITEELLKTSQGQLKDAQRRFRSRVAEKGEVARYQSQVYTQKASINSLIYQKSKIIQSLKELIPSIAQKNIKLAPYELEKSVNTVLACTQKIARFKDSPLNFTLYDEVIKAATVEQDLEDKLASMHQAPQIKLIGQYDLVGKSLASEDTFDSISDDRRSVYAVGLKVVFPFGSAPSDSREIKKKLVEKSKLAERELLMGKIASYHTQVLQQIGLLRNIINNQQQNTKYLSISLKDSQKKYNQARISAEIFVRERADFLQSNLNEINTKLTTIHTILDYLSVFTEFPCKLNLGAKL